MFAGGRRPRHLRFWHLPRLASPHWTQGRKRDHLAPLKDFGWFIKWAGPHLAGYEENRWTQPWGCISLTTPRNIGRVRGPNLSKANGRPSGTMDGPADPSRGVQCAVCGYSTKPRGCPLETQKPLGFFFGVHGSRHASQVGRLCERRLIFSWAPVFPARVCAGRSTTLADALGLSVVGGTSKNLIRSGDQEYWVQGPIQTYAAKNEVRHWIP